MKSLFNRCSMITTDDKNSHYNYQEVTVWVERKGKELLGNKFIIHHDDLQIIHKLIAYFIADNDKAKIYGIDLQKGLLLSGPVGCGKTALMHIFKWLAPVNKKYLIKICRDVSFEFIKNGYETIHQYSRSASEYPPKQICFDDLGTESNLKYYGNECNVMAEILLNRYDLFVSKKIKTHITTNLGATEIEKMYGTRVRSRMREMFNLIAFNATTPDKRL